MSKFTILFSLLLILNLFSENVMPEFDEIVSSSAGSQFGMNIFTLDFNGDGYQDLLSKHGNPAAIAEDSWFKGKIEIYYGSENGFSDSSDFIFESTVVDTLISITRFYEVLNIGDVNGDSCDDLLYTVSKSWYDDENRIFDDSFCILFGGSNPDTEPDFSYSHGFIWGSHSYGKLGDVNGDGYDDIGVCVKEEDNYEHYYILYGNTFNLELVSDEYYDNSYYTITGLGDINGDGYNDFTFFVFDSIIEENNLVTYYGINKIFLGALEHSEIEEIEYSFSTNYPNGYCMFMPAGDWNNDGFDDFVQYSPSSEEGVKLFYGGEAIDFNSYSNIYFFSPLFKPEAGDFNGDGNTDLAVGHRIYGVESFLLYLGNQNGLIDLELRSNHMFGQSIAVSDFNHDGFDDLAVSQPGRDDEESYFGRIRFFRGHANLTEQDPEVSLEKPEIINKKIKLTAYPNPFNPTIKIDIEGLEKGNSVLEIFNVKGQKVEQFNIKGTGKQQIIWNAKDKASNIYLCRLKLNNKIIYSKKITLMK